MALLSLHEIYLTIVGPALLEGASLNVESGERVCLLGRNGAGKSSLLKLIGGEIAPQRGEMILQKGANLAFLPQEVPENLSGLVEDIVSVAHQSEPHEINAILMQLGLDADAEFSTLSGGLKRRVLLARALAAKPDILLLDEPTNHLDIASIAWLEEFLTRSGQAVLFVTHDRAFLQKMATRIVEIDRAKLTSWTCDYQTYLERKAAQLETEEKQNALFDKKLAQEEVWVRKGVKARTTRNEGRVRALEQLRRDRSERREVAGLVNLQSHDAGRSGHRVVEAENINFSYGDNIIARDFSTRIMRGDKVGLIGANGAGKTTLLRLLLGQIEPQSGEVKLGTRLEIAYFDQLRAALDDEKTVQQNVAGDNSTVLFNGERRHIVGYLQEFLFEPERARARAGVLSGGERNRLLLAKLWTQPSNVLVMDEPTNDLDLETLELLEDLLVNYSGTLLLVSHDRAFLNNVVTSTLAPLGDGIWRESVGGWDDYLRQIKAQAPKSTPESGAKSAKSQNAKPQSRPRKITFKETRELAELPARLENLESEHALLVQAMSDASFYQKESTEIAAAKARLQKLEAEQVAAFARWEELEKLNAQAA